MLNKNLEADKISQFLNQIETNGIDLEMALLEISNNPNLPNSINLLKQSTINLLEGKSLFETPNPNEFIRLQWKIIKILELFNK